MHPHLISNIRRLGALRTAAPRRPWPILDQKVLTRSSAGRIRPSKNEHARGHQPDRGHLRQAHRLAKENHAQGDSSYGLDAEDNRVRDSKLLVTQRERLHRGPRAKNTRRRVPLGWGLDRRLTRIPVRPNHMADGVDE